MSLKIGDKAPSFDSINQNGDKISLSDFNFKKKNNLFINNIVEPRKRPLSSMSPTIVFDDKNNIINRSKLVGNISLDTFFFDLNLILSGIKPETVLNYLFSHLYKVNKTSHINFNGNLKINLNEINNRLFENLVININFLDEKISLNNSSLNLKKFILNQMIK